MKHVVAICVVISILSLTGSTFGDEKVGCPTTPDEANTLNLKDIMFDHLHECFGKVGDIDYLTIQQVFSADPMNIFKAFCEKQDSINNCLSTTSVSSAGCHNETEHRALGFVEDMLKTALSYVCVEHGENFAFLMFKVFSEQNSTVERNLVQDCFKTAQSTVEPGNNTDMSTKMLGFYGEVKAFKHCIVHKFRRLDRTDGARALNRAIYEAEFVLNGILRSMKCLHTQTRATVLCQNLDTAESINETVCPFVSDNEGEPVGANAFSDFTASCIIKNLNQLNFDDLRTFIKLDEYKAFFHTYCQNRPIILTCVADVSSYSKLCQNQAENQLEDLLNGLFENILESGCKQDGNTFATLFNGILNVAERAVDNATLRSCGEAAGESFKGLSVSSSRIDSYASATRLVYITLNTFKQCIMDGASDLGSFKTVFDSFTNDVLRSAQCVHPDTRATVLCETIINNV